MIKLSINIDKIDNASLYKNENGTYLTLYLHENRGGRNDYGNDGFAIQGLSKEKRESGVKGSIVGNWKHQTSDSDTAKADTNTEVS